MDLLGGSKERKIMEERREDIVEKGGEEENKEEEEEITKEELIEHLRRKEKGKRKLEKGKTPGENEIENEAWRLMSQEIGEVLWKLINNIWKEGGIPDG